MTQDTMAFFSDSEQSLPSLDIMVNNLTQVGLLGTTLAPPEHNYYAGPRFIHLISFLGCSPHIPLSAEEGMNFCQIQLTGPLSTPELMIGSNTRPPRCPQCNGPIKDWKSRLKAAEKRLPPLIACPNCMESIPTKSLLWRQQAGLGHSFILIRGIFPGEAVPVDELMQCLGEMGGSWDYCYLQDPITLSSNEGPLQNGEF